jgi:hypothetical protein
MSEIHKRGLLVATEVVKAVLMVNQVEEVASLAAAEGLLLRVAWLVMGEACLVAEDAYPVEADCQPEHVNSLGVLLGKESFPL